MGRLVLYGVGGILAIAVIFKILLAVLGPLVALTAYLAARLLPIVLVGWLVVWLWRRWSKQPG
ncbi:MAG TPA: hypothetical protein VF212_14905 [Longimicrobiales bacterium]